MWEAVWQYYFVWGGGGHIEKYRPVDPVCPTIWRAYFCATICLFTNFAPAVDVIHTSHSK